MHSNLVSVLLMRLKQPWTPKCVTYTRILLELSTVFCFINHCILLYCLLLLGDTILQWFQSFLKNKFQSVVLGDCCSAPWPLATGLPILSLMVSSIYIKLLGEVIQRFGLNHQQ